MKTVILSGNGATENGWDPVKKAIAELYPEFLNNSIDPNIIFANLIYQLRFLMTQMKSNSNLELQEKGKKLLADRIKTYENLRTKIAQYIEDAQTECSIKLRESFKQVVRDYKNDIFHIVDLNWDTLKIPFLTQANLLERIGLLYLHGNIKDPKSFYFPSETTEEDYRREEIPNQGERNGLAMQILEEAERVIIYGCSLSILDIELHLLLADSFHNTENPKEFLIFDPNCAEIRKLLSFYFPAKSENIKCFY